MILRKNSFFLLLLLFMVLPFGLYNLVWLLRSEKATGTVYMLDNKSAIIAQAQQGGEHVNATIIFPAGKAWWFINANDASLRDRDTLSVRYLSSDPDDARINSFSGIWGSTFLYACIPVAMLLLIWLYPNIVPRHALIRLKTTKPFVSMYTPVDTI